MSCLSLSRIAVILLAEMAMSHGDFTIAHANRRTSAKTDQPQRDAEALVRPFSEIRTALSREIDGIFEPARVRGSATFKLLIATHSTELWNERILRPGDDLGLPIV